MNYKIVLIKDLRKGDLFLWNNRILTVSEEFKLDPEYATGMFSFGEFGVIGYKFDFSKYDVSIDTYSDFPVIKLI